MVARGGQSENPGGGPPATGASTSPTSTKTVYAALTTNSFQSFLATSGPVIRLRSGNVEAMIACDRARLVTVWRWARGRWNKLSNSVRSWRMSLADSGNYCSASSGSTTVWPAPLVP